MNSNTGRSTYLERKLRQLFRKDIGHNLHYVSKRLKPCYLWDISEPDVTTADECIQHFDQSSDTGHLRTIQIGDHDLVVCNTEATLQHLSDVLSSNSVRFVDVSSCHKQPRLLPALPSDLEAMLRSLLRQLDGFRQSDRRNLRLKLECNWNLCSAFGVFLGFPVVYWFGADSDSNCLSMEELKVCSVRCLKPFGVVLGLDSRDSATSEVYSFSFPLLFDRELGAHVQRWFQNLATCFAEFELTMCSRVCCYPTVAL
ncbi:unnamed protein product [Ixodes hexagonus]